MWGVKHFDSTFNSQTDVLVPADDRSRLHDIKSLADFEVFGQDCYHFGVLAAHTVKDEYPEFLAVLLPHIHDRNLFVKGFEDGCNGTGCLKLSELVNGKEAARYIKAPFPDPPWEHLRLLQNLQPISTALEGRAR